MQGGRKSAMLAALGRDAGEELKRRGGPGCFPDRAGLCLASYSFWQTKA
jgi:hypothetical protein